MYMRAPLPVTYRFELHVAPRRSKEKYKFAGMIWVSYRGLMRDMKWILKLNVHLLLGRILSGRHCSDIILDFAELVI